MTQEKLAKVAKMIHIEGDMPVELRRWNDDAPHAFAGQMFIYACCDDAMTMGLLVYGPQPSINDPEYKLRVLHPLAEQMMPVSIETLRQNIEQITGTPVQVDKNC
jgi:hypothetical protein